MKQKRSEDEDEMLWHTLFSAIALVIILLTIVVLLLSDSHNKKILYDGEFFEIYQKGDSVYIWNKDIDGGLIKLDPEDPLIQRLWEKIPEGNSQTHMGEQ